MPDPWTLKNRNSAKKRFDNTLSTNARDLLQIFSCAYITYTLLAHVQRLASPLEIQAGVKNSLLLEQS